MWIQKSEEEKICEEINENEEFKRTRIKKGIKYAVWTFVVYSTLAPLYYVLFGVPNGRHNAAPETQINWDDLPHYIHEILDSSVFISILVFIATFFWGKKIKSTSLMCNRCNEKKNYSKDKHCACGGEYDFLYNFKGVENADNPVSPTTTLFD